MLKMSVQHRRLIAITFIAALGLATFMVSVAKSETPRQRVFIRSNGSVEPASAPIQQDGNRYTFTGDVYAELVVEKNGIILDGQGYMLHGPYNGTAENLWVLGEGSDQVSPGMRIQYSVGVDLGGDASGLTIMNLNIKNFSIGTYIWTTNNTFVGNSVSECIVGVLLSGSENNITSNFLTTNEVGLFFGTNQPGTVPLNLTVSHNSFKNNIRQLGGCLCQKTNATEPIHTWDNGREGNYWSDYNGTDLNADGVGDMPYVFDVQNEDRYPLMVSLAAPPTVASGFPVYTAVLILVIVAVAVLILGAAWNVRRKRNKSNGIPESSVG
jgi:nitrous oxidase accessory protein NosD